MSGRVQFAYTISKEACELIKQGKAFLQSGGVRTADGKLVELAVPGVQSVGKTGVPSFSIPGTAFSGVGMVSSIVGNVQNAYIQKGVNEANRKLNEVIRTQAHMVSQLNVLTGLQVVNLAAGLINVGVSIRYLPKIEQQVSETKVLLEKLSEHIEKQELYKYIQDCKRYSSYMSSFLKALKHNDSSANAKDLTDVAVYLDDIIRKFNNHDIDGTVGCDIIFGLLPIYVQAVKIYSSGYYYKYKELPPVYDECLEVLKSLNSDTFCEAMKKHLLINYPEIHIEDMYKGFHTINTSIENSIDNFLFEPKIWEALPQKEYESLDEIVTNKIKLRDLIIEGNDKVLIPIGSSKDETKDFVERYREEEYSKDMLRATIKRYGF